MSVTSSITNRLPDDNLIGKDELLIRIPNNNDDKDTSKSSNQISPTLLEQTFNPQRYESVIMN